MEIISSLARRSTRRSAGSSYPSRHAPAGGGPDAAASRTCTSSCATTWSRCCPRSVWRASTRTRSRSGNASHSPVTPGPRSPSTTSRGRPRTAETRRHASSMLRARSSPAPRRRSSTVVVLDGGQVLEAPHAVHDLDDRAYVLGRQALRAQGELLDALVRERRPQPRVRRLVRVDEAPGAHAEERRDALDDAQARRRAVPAAQRAEVRLVDGVALL